MYSSTLYDPSISTNNTTINPQKIKISVQKGSTPLAGCPVSWQAKNGTGGGWIYPDSPVTGADGTLSAWWIAGTDANQTAVVTVTHADGSSASTSITGQASPHATRANSIHLSYSTPKWDKFKVTVTPRTWAPTTYYETIQWSGAYTGIQPDKVLFSVWGLNGVNPTILRQASNAQCGGFGGEGTGLKCWIPFTPTVNVPYVFEVDTAINAPNTEDYSVLFTDPVANTTTEIAAMRYPSSPNQSGSDSFVEDWAQTLSSCLANNLRSADFSAQHHDAKTGQWVAITKASGSAVFTPNHNEVCKNYQFSVVDGQFRASTGGMSAGQPLGLPGGPSRISLQLP